MFQEAEEGGRIPPVEVEQSITSIHFFLDIPSYPW